MQAGTSKWCATMAASSASCGSLWQGMMTPSVWCGKARLASAATTAESMPPERPKTAPEPPPAGDLGGDPVGEMFGQSFHT